MGPFLQALRESPVPDSVSDSVDAVIDPAQAQRPDLMQHVADIRKCQSEGGTRGAFFNNLRCRGAFVAVISAISQQAQQLSSNARKPLHRNQLVSIRFKKEFTECPKNDSIEKVQRRTDAPV